jgi:hypothetical protein
MTAIFYPDCSTASDSREFTLEARSPHNGTIRHKDGRKPSDEEFGFKYRQHQSEFRYRLLDNSPPSALGRLFRGAGPSVVWERWQADREDSPGELVVSDDGWAVIRTHGFSPDVIAVGPDGKDAVRVRISGAEEEPPAPVPDGRAPVYYWPLEQVGFSTAGHYWSGHSWRSFFEYAGEPHFLWRTSWGQRLVLDLGRGVAFTDAQSLPAELAVTVVAAEQSGVTELLAALSGRMAEVRTLLSRRREDEACDRDPLLDRVRQVTAALHLVGVHRLRECVPLLRDWEALDCPSSSLGSTAMPGRWWMQNQLFRPVAHHALKVLGEEPRGYATYGFIAGEFDAPERFPIPECIPDRAGRVGLLRPEMPAETVLEYVGSPDFVRRSSRPEGRRYRWSEDWEYDLHDGTAWRTVRLHWEDGGRVGVLTTIDEVPPYWLDGDEREAEYLRF